MNIEWSPGATALARQYMHDQDGMRAMGAAVAAPAVDPYDLITIDRVDRVAAD